MVDTRIDELIYEKMLVIESFDDKSANHPSVSNNSMKNHNSNYPFVFLTE